MQPLAASVDRIEQTQHHLFMALNMIDCRFWHSGICVAGKDNVNVSALLCRLFGNLFDARFISHIFSSANKGTHM